MGGVIDFLLFAVGIEYMYNKRRCYMSLMSNTTNNCGYSFKKKAFSNNYIGYHIINICSLKSKVKTNKPLPSGSLRRVLLVGKSQLSKVEMRPMKVSFKDNLAPLVYDSPMGIVSTES